MMKPGCREKIMNVIFWSALVIGLLCLVLLVIDLMCCLLN